MDNPSTLLDLFTEVSGLVSDYGVTTSLVSAALAVMCLKINKVTKLISKALSKSADQFAVHFPSIVNQSSEVLARLRHLRSDIRADRIMVFQYHNGSHNISGVDFAKMSCTHEVVKPGLKSVQQELLNLPVSAYMSLTDAAFGKENTYIPRTTVFSKYDISTYEFFKNHRAKSAVVLPITDDDDNIFGFIVVEYMRITTFNSQELRMLLFNMVERISAMLDSSPTVERT